MPINKTDNGVTASIINDGSAYRLVLTSKETGGSECHVQNHSRRTMMHNTDTGGLSRFAHGASNKNMKQTSVAQNAKIEMNGITITRSKNDRQRDPGVTLNLNGVTETGKVVKLTIGKDTSTIESQIRAGGYLQQDHQPGE